MSTFLSWVKAIGFDGCTLKLITYMKTTVVPVPIVDVHVLFKAKQVQLKSMIP